MDSFDQVEFHVGTSEVNGVVLTIIDLADESGIRMHMTVEIAEQLAKALIDQIAYVEEQIEDAVERLTNFE